ncbi:MAG: ABC transporter ATP-binding protein [Eubacteriales bacterium]|nr:ABC transporter ATP-binding protein [Eubacteriales bacterium]
MSAILQVNNVRYDYKTAQIVTHAVRGVTVEFELGKFYTISGRSGSGKSTLLSLMSAINRPLDGDILYDGKSILSLNSDDYRRANLGIIYQSFYLFPQLSALENVMLPMEFAGTKLKVEREERARGLLSMVGLDERHAKKRPNQLSGGEQQRVAVARALSLDPKVILGDEPTGNLDSENSANIIAILRHLVHEQGKCVIVVSHSSEVCEASDVRYAMQDGRLVL